MPSHCPSPPTPARQQATPTSIGREIKGRSRGSPRHERYPWLKACTRTIHRRPHYHFYAATPPSSARPAVICSGREMQDAHLIHPSPRIPQSNLRKTPRLKASPIPASSPHHQPSTQGREAPNSHPPPARPPSHSSSPSPHPLPSDCYPQTHSPPPTALGSSRANRSDSGADSPASTP